MVPEFVEKIIIALVKRWVTDEVVQEAKVHLVALLKEIAQKSDNQIDDYVVSLVAQALGVPYDMPVQAAAPVEVSGELPSDAQG